MKLRSIACLSSALVLLCLPAQAVTPESKAHTKKGIEFYNAGKAKEAIEEFKKAIALDPQNADYHRNLASVYQSQKMMPEALKEAEAAAKAKSSDLKNLELAASLAFLQNKFADAEKYYRQAMKLAPKNGDYHTKVCLCLKMAGKKAEFEKEVKDTLAKDPKDSGALRLMSKILLDQKKTEEAEKMARDGVKYGAKDPESHLALANVLKARGKDKEAVSEYETALTLQPDHPSAKEIRETITYIKNKVDSRIP